MCSPTWHAMSQGVSCPSRFCLPRSRNDSRHHKTTPNPSAKGLFGILRSSVSARGTKHSMAATSTSWETDLLGNS